MLYNYFNRIGICAKTKKVCMLRKDEKETGSISFHMTCHSTIRAMPNHDNVAANSRTIS